MAEFRAGHWDAAFGAALESVRLAEDSDRRTDLPNCLVTVSLVEAARGLSDARVHAERAVRLAAAIDLLVVEAQARSVLGLLDLGLGNLDAAIDQLETVRSRRASYRNRTGLQRAVGTGAGRGASPFWSPAPNSADR